ncbi:MFS transporter [Halegenticoccus tardaugens]|uniref:MFS transporter n=1 Tax=Halegenticoccus tardaugens TaxID=2071624 RepID=UPI00100B15EC|nr:MFS transporter [Halegenticoccus tardaugens]
MEANDRSIATFTMLAHGMFHTYELSIPLFVVVWLDTFSVSAAVLGAVVSVGYGLVGVGAIPSGLLADRYGSRTLILVSVAGMGIGFFLLSLATDIFFIGGAIVLWGLAASLYHPAGLSLISRGATDRGSVFAHHGVGGNIGTAFGPLIAAVLLVFFSWRVVVALLILPAIAVILLGYKISFEDGNASTGASVTGTDGGSATTRSFNLRSMLAESRLLFSAGFTVIFVIVMLYGVYYRGLLTFLPDTIANLPRFEPVLLFGRTVEPAQYVYTGLLTVGIFGQYVGGNVTNHVRTEYALFGSLAVLVVAAFVFIPVSGVGVVPFLFVCAVLGFCLYATAPIYQVLIAESAAADVHGLSYGFTYLGMFGVGALGAALSGFVLTTFDAPTLFAVLGGFAAFATVLVLVALRLPSATTGERA